MMWPDDLDNEGVFLNAMWAVQSVAWWHLFPFRPGDRVMFNGEPRNRNAQTVRVYARAGTVVRVRSGALPWWRGRVVVRWDGKKLTDDAHHNSLQPDDPVVRAARTAKMKGPRPSPSVARAIAAVEKAIAEHADAETIARAAIDAYRSRV